MASRLPSFVADALENADRSKLELAGLGCFAHVFKIADTGYVIKHTSNHPTVGNLEPTERQIYERLGRHPYILRYYGDYRQGNGLLDGLVFQYQAAGTLTDNLPLSNYAEKRAKWPLKAAEALRYIHSKNVVHSDVGCHDFLVQGDGSLALGDFGGSVIDDAAAVVSYSTRYSRPVTIMDDSDSSKIDDLFALDTVIYEISVGHVFFPDKSSREVGILLQPGRFPDLDSAGTIPINVKK